MMTCPVMMTMMMMMMMMMYVVPCFPQQDTQYTLPQPQATSLTVVHNAIIDALSSLIYPL